MVPEAESMVGIAVILGLIVLLFGAFIYLTGFVLEYVVEKLLLISPNLTHFERIAVGAGSWFIGLMLKSE